MKIWDYTTRKLLYCLDIKINSNRNPQTWVQAIEIELELKLDYSYLNWINEWISDTKKRDLHLYNDTIYQGCLPEIVNLNPDNGGIELIFRIDSYRTNIPFSEIFEIHRDLMINDILSNSPISS